MEPGSTGSASTKPQSTRRRALRRMLLTVLALVVFAVIITPWVVARTEYRHQIIASSTPVLPEGTYVDSASFGWFSPIVLRNVRVPDDVGAAAAKVERIIVDRTLLSILLDRESDRHIRLINPLFTLVVTDEGTNYDPLMQAIRAQPKSDRPIQITIERGRLKLLNSAKQTLALATDLQATYRKHHGAALEVDLFGEGTVSDSSEGGRWRLELDLVRELDDELPREATINLQLAEVNAEEVGQLFSPWFRPVVSAGALHGDVRVEWDRDQEQPLSLHADLHGDDLSVLISRFARESGEPFSLKPQKATVQFDAHYHSADDRLEVERLAVAADATDLALSGTIDNAATTRDLDLRGRIDFDLMSVLQPVFEEIGDEVVVNGLQMHVDSVTGPLRPHLRVDAEDSSPGNVEYDFVTAKPWWAELVAEAEISWANAELYGVHLDRGRLAAGLDHERLTFRAEDLALGGGLVFLHGQLLLGTLPRELTIESGHILRNVRLTSQMAHTWLKYISPMVARATDVNGEFSLHMERVWVDLRNPEGARLEGTLTIHDARMGPGPLSKMVLTAAGQIRNLATEKRSKLLERLGGEWMMMPTQDVVFKVAGGRVSHDNVTFLMDDVLVQSEGYVGLDQSLNMLITVPIRDEWLDDGLVSRSLRGEVIELPVHGSLGSPKLERESLVQFGKRVGIRAGGELLFDVLRNRLESRDR